MKQKIKIASRRPTPKSLSRNHYTTLGFGVPYPIFCEETINKDKFSFKVSNFSRLSPMFLPNLGTLQLKIHAFYVPFRLVWNHFENFKEGIPSWNSAGAQVYKNVPVISDATLTDLFMTNQGVGSTQLVRKVPVLTDPYDIAFFEQPNTESHFRFTKFGKEVLHTLYALGYNFKFIDHNNPTLDMTHNITYSALPLLCYFKVFLDYFIPSQLQPSSVINRLFHEIHELTDVQISTHLSYQYLVNCFSEIRLYYQNNYFTSSWLSPNAPVSGLNNIGTSSFDLPVINSISSQKGLSSNVNDRLSEQPLYNDTLSVSRSVATVSNNTASSINNQAISNTLTADGITFMQKFASFIKRSNFAGSRSVERILARFGVHVDDFQIGLSKYLGSSSIDLQKVDVTVTGNTQQAGEFVGKGFFSGGSDRVFKCNCDFAGMIFATASIETPSTYVAGVRRRNLHIKPLDFYTPEFDGSLMQAISGCEVENRYLVNCSDWLNSVSSMGLMYDKIYGFSPRYSEYCTSIDDVTGDFAVPRLSQNIDAFILPRRLYDYGQLYDLMANNNASQADMSDFVYNPKYMQSGMMVNPVDDLFSNDSVQFNRIFKDISGESDPIFSVFRIDCVVNSVKLPLNESAEIIGRGNEIEFETNGVHLS